ncbi:MAG: SDR family oxidoreductase [Acidimicrobiales bacterium]
MAYAAAKAAILGMTLPLARDLAPLGIRACAIAPATMATPAVLRLLERLDEDPTAGMVFPARLGRPDEFAELVDAVVRNPYLNGENIRSTAPSGWPEGR